MKKKIAKPTASAKPPEAPYSFTRSFLLLLATKAPAEVVADLKMPPGTVWAQCLLQRILNIAAEEKVFLGFDRAPGVR